MEQNIILGSVASSVRRLELRDMSLAHKLNILTTIIRRRYPYHCAVLEASIQKDDELRRMIASFPGVIVTSVGHWGCLVIDRPATNWILNQCDADVEFWKIYASQASNPIVKSAAIINHRLASAFFPRVYSNVGNIICVCEEDRQLTEVLAPKTPVHVVANGIDCLHYSPNRFRRDGQPRILFTGTSASRNLVALKRFVGSIFPLIQREVPCVELLIAGNFAPSAQAEFKVADGVRFTGWVEDIRPFFDQSDVFIVPFNETHGSKLKVAEAMAMGMPIVSTPAGIRGFQLVDDESVMVAETDEQFALDVVTLLRDPAFRARIGERARQVALSSIDWQVLGQRLISIVETVFQSYALVD